MEKDISTIKQLKGGISYNLRPKRCGFYRPILKESWQICKNYKFLWFFGFFALLLSNKGELNLFSNLISKINNQSVILFNFKDFFQFENIKLYLKGFFSSDSLILIGILSLVLLIFFIWLAITSRAAIVNTVKEVKNKKGVAFKTDFKTSFKKGANYFWPVLGLNILLKLIAFVFLALFTIPFLLFFSLGNNSIWISIIIILLFFLYIPLNIVLSFINNYAICYLILEKQKIIQSIKKGFKLFIKNWLISIELAFILFLISILAGLISIVLIFILNLPLLIFIFIFQTLNFPFGILIISILILLITVFIFTILISIFGAFFYNSWTLLFINLTKNNNLKSKLVRIFYKSSIS